MVKTVKTNWGGGKRRQACVKVILQFSSGTNIITPENKDPDSGEEEEEKNSNVHSENKECNKYSLDSDE